MLRRGSVASRGRAEHPRQRLLLLFLARRARGCRAGPAPGSSAVRRFSRRSEFVSRRSAIRRGYPLAGLALASCRDDEQLARPDEAVRALELAELRFDLGPSPAPARPPARARRASGGARRTTPARSVRIRPRTAIRTGAVDRAEPDVGEARVLELGLQHALAPPRLNGPGWPGAGGGSSARRRMIPTGTEKKPLRSGVEYTIAANRPPGRSAARSGERSPAVGEVDEPDARDRGVEGAQARRRAPRRRPCGSRRLRARRAAPRRRRTRGCAGRCQWRAPRRPGRPAAPW